MSTFEKAEEDAIKDALGRQAEPTHFPHGLTLRDPPELGWIIIETPKPLPPEPAPKPPKPLPSYELSPQIRHINRNRRGFQWLGPAIEKPEGLR